LGTLYCGCAISNLFNVAQGNGKIDFQEFLLLVKKYERPLSEEREIREMFDMIDADRNGFIDAKELKSTFAGLGVPLSSSDIKDMLKEANIQGSRIFYEGVKYFPCIMKVLSVIC
jgi:calmodulin